MEATVSASDWFDLGCELQRAERYQEALSAFEQAQALDPNIPSLKNRIASTHWGLKNHKTALDLYEALVRETPGDVGVWVNLSINAFQCRQFDKSLAAAERAFKLNPNNPVQLHGYSIILREFGRFKQARRLLERSVSLDPENADTRVQLGLRQLEEGDYANGWKSFDVRWKWKHWRGMPWVDSPVPRWAGESLAQKNIFLWYEPWQGIGDEILFLRYAAPLAERAHCEGGLIMLACHEPLFTLFGRSLAEHCNILFLTNEGEGTGVAAATFFR
jgi:tetratricopeptide (TPR) repeat protein